MLHAALEEHRRCHCKHITCLAGGAVLIIGTITFVEGRATKVHRAHGIPNKGMDTGIEGLGIAGTLSEVEVL